MQYVKSRKQDVKTRLQEVENEAQDYVASERCRSVVELSAGRLRRTQSALTLHTDGESRPCDVEFVTEDVVESGICRRLAKDLGQQQQQQDKEVRRKKSSLDELSQDELIKLVSQHHAGIAVSCLY